MEEKGTPGALVGMGSLPLEFRRAGFLSHALEKQERRDFEIPQWHALLTLAFSEHLTFHPTLRRFQR